MNENIFLLKVLGLALLIPVCVACAGKGKDAVSAGGESGVQAAAIPAALPMEAPLLPEEAAAEGELSVALEKIAEIERSGSFFAGLGLAESAIREKAGDFAGAAVAAYKELSWAYGYGGAAGPDVLEGLQNALALLGDGSAPAGHDAARAKGSIALRGCIAFASGDWAAAEELLSQVLPPDEEPDSFLRWMLMVSALEGDAARPGRLSYGAIRARYALFPEYWYRGARAFSDADASISVAFAEQCINLCPTGPFAEESRKILASHAGLLTSSSNNGVHSDIRTRAEIENVIRASVSMNNPAILEELFPLMALPDNPYTIFALGALKVLSSVPDFKDFFVQGAQRSPGRLGERLHYISRG